MRVWGWNAWQHESKAAWGWPNAVRRWLDPCKFTPTPHTLDPLTLAPAPPGSTRSIGVIMSKIDAREAADAVGVTTDTVKVSTTRPRGHTHTQPHSEPHALRDRCRGQGCPRLAWRERMRACHTYGALGAAAGGGAA